MREPSAELVVEGCLLRLGEELAKTFRPKLRTHAAAVPQRRAGPRQCLTPRLATTPPHAHTLLIIFETIL